MLVTMHLVHYGLCFALMQVLAMPQFPAQPFISGQTTTTTTTSLQPGNIGFNTGLNGGLTPIGGFGPGGFPGQSFGPGGALQSTGQLSGLLGLGETEILALQRFGISQRMQIQVFQGRVACSSQGQRFGVFGSGQGARLVNPREVVCEGLGNSRVRSERI